MAPDRKTTRNEQKRRMAAVIACFVKAQPDPHCELFYQTPYQLLVSVVLSAQATDKSVNRCMQPLYTTGLDPSQMLALGYAAFLDKIRSIGLAPTKAKNIMALTKILVEKHGGEVPRLRGCAHGGLHGAPGRRDIRPGLLVARGQVRPGTAAATATATAAL